MVSVLVSLGWTDILLFLKEEETCLDEAMRLKSALPLYAVLFLDIDNETGWRSPSESKS